MLQAKIDCPHCGKSVIVRERIADPRAYDKVAKATDEFFKAMDRAFDGLSKSMSKIKFTK